MSGEYHDSEVLSLGQYVKKRQGPLLEGAGADLALRPQF